MEMVITPFWKLKKQYFFSIYVGDKKYTENVTLITLFAH